MQRSVPRLGRRALLSGLASIGLGCSRGPGDAGAGSSSPPLPPAAGWVDVPFPAIDGQDEELAAIFAPPGTKGLPALIALHGRGEAGRGLAAGAHGWRDDYGLDRVRARLEAPPLTSADALDMLSGARLDAINASLAKDPWRGVVLACPYTPVPTGKDPESAAPFGRFVVGPLLAKIAEVAGEKPLGVGIDGVSMGGRYALEVGLAHPTVFASVGAMQPAISEAEAPRFAELAATARATKAQALRLVSSEDDPFLTATRALSAELDRRSVPHQLIVTMGPHDYVWNRGPGGVELLVFHERALRGLAPP